MKTLFLLVTLLFSFIGFAQEPPDKKISISGSVDVYFKTNLTGPNDASDDEEGNSIF